MRFAYKLLRVSAWTLLVVMPVSILSGFAMVKQFLVPWFKYDLAVYLHANLTAVLIILLVYVHSLTGILVIFQRHAKWNRKIFKLPAVIFWTALFLLMGFLFIAQPPAPKNDSGTAQAATSIPPDAPSASKPAEPATGAPAPATPATNTATVKSFTMSEISTHNSLDDCWLLISGKVYDITGYSSSHPGGVETIAPTCGTDATRAYDTKNAGQPHSSYARRLLDDYYIGDLKK